MPASLTWVKIICFSYFIFVQRCWRGLLVLRTFRWSPFLDTYVAKVLRINTRCSAEGILALTHPTYRLWLTSDGSSLFSVYSAHKRKEFWAGFVKWRSRILLCARTQVCVCVCLVIALWHPKLENSLALLKYVLRTLEDGLSLSIGWVVIVTDWGVRRWPWELLVWRKQFLPCLWPATDVLHLKIYHTEVHSVFVCVCVCLR